MAKQKTATVAPRRRFPAFSESGDWRVGPLAQLATVVAGQSPDGSNYNDVGQGIPFYQGKSEFGAIYLEEPTKWTTQTTKVAASGDIVMSVRAPVGALNVTTQEICIGRGLAAIKPKAEKWFLYYLLDRISGSIIGNGGSVFDSINKDQIEKLRVFWPVDRVEQQKIADCLTSLDEVIAAQGHKVEALKAHKCGLMQQLFPREGETCPRLRFPEFRDAPEWVEAAISEIGDVITGNTPSTTRQDFYGGDRLFVSPADISDRRFVESTKTTLSESGFAQARAIKPNSVLFVCIGSTIGKVAQNRYECATNQQINAIEPKTGFNADFVFYALELASKSIAELAGRQAVPIINKSQFSAVQLRVASLAEQQRIADCLSSLDTEIAAESHKLAALKTHKQGLMQQLFPAPEAASA